MSWPEREKAERLKGWRTEREGPIDHRGRSLGLCLPAFQPSSLPAFQPSSLSAFAPPLAARRLPLARQEHHRRHRPFARLAGQPQRAAVEQDDLLRQGETHAEAVRLVRVEGEEETLCLGGIE